MVSDGLSVEYENGVADVLAFLGGDSVTVERDVSLPGRESGVDRQIDVLVRGTIFGLTGAVMVVDAKRWNSNIDVADAGAFKSLVEDVGADFGLLVTSKGISPAARTILANARGMRIDVLSLDELSGWSPPGTRDVTHRVKKSQVEEASAALRRAGFRVRQSNDGRTESDEVALAAYRHYPREEAPSLYEPTGEALRSVGIEPDVLSSGVVTIGGTPGHRFLEVTIDAVPTGMKILAADEAEVLVQLEVPKSMLSAQGINPADHILDVIRPPGWPNPRRMFG